MSDVGSCRIGFHTENGRLVARDQHGNRVDCVRAISVSQRFNDATFITVEFVSLPNGPESLLKGGVPE